MSKSNSKHTPKTWYRLDLSAIVYPTLQRRDFSSVYRLSVLLKDPVQPDILQQAVDIAIKRFPTYHSAMRKGFFWRYLEPNTRPGPFVKPDIRNFCMPMPFKSNNRYLVRFYWYDRRISLEAHHSLGDGTGGMYLLQTVTAVYLRLLGHEISNGGFVLDVNETPDPEEFEDAYMRYANARVCPPRPAEKTYRVRGTKEPFYTLNVIDGIMSVSAVQKDYGIPKRRAFIFSFTKAGARFSSAPAPCADRHARQPAPFFSIQNAAQLYHDGLSVYRSKTW